MVRRRQGTPPEVSEACVVGCEGVKGGFRRLLCLCLGSAAGEPGTTLRWRTFIWIIMNEKGGVKNASIVVLGRRWGGGKLAEKLT